MILFNSNGFYNVDTRNAELRSITWATINNLSLNLSKSEEIVTYAPTWI